MKTKVLFAPRESLLRGVNTMADAVASTLGPKGQNVAIAKIDFHDHIFERTVLHDGVSVAKAIDLPDEAENMGAQLLKEAAQKQVDQVGDGTTAVMVLAQALIQECFKVIATGVSPMTLRPGLELAASDVCEALEDLSTAITTDDEAIQIASISAEDSELGKLVATTIKEAGTDGIVTVEESKSLETLVEKQQGMQLEHGYVSQYFVTNADRMEAVIEHPRFLITDRPLSNFNVLVPLLEGCVKNDYKLVIIAPDITGDALASFVQNKMTGKFQSLCIRAPSFGQNQKEILQDIALLTGATFLTDQAGFQWEDLTVEMLGTAESITANVKATLITGGKGDVTERVAGIKKQVADETDDFALTQLRERLAKLTTGISVIRVGGVTEVEMKERKERVIDAVAATQAALASGIVPGGESIYLDARSAIEKSTDPAAQILYKALAKPFMKLMSNGGYEGGAYLEKRQAAHRQGLDNAGINILTGEVADMVLAGIIDPLAVPLNAVQNAVSVAILIMTTGTTIIPFNEYKVDIAKLIG